MNIYLLYGTDKALIKKEINNIIDKEQILKDSVSEYSLLEDSLFDIVEDANTLGMFSPKKVIVINEAVIFTGAKEKIENIELLEGYLNNYNKNTIMIFNVFDEKLDNRKKIVKLVEKIGKIIEFNKENICDINKYITNYIKDNDYKLSSGDITYLIRRLGNNYDLIMNELDKLMLYKIEEKEITKIDIDNLTEPSMEEEIFSLSEAVVKDDVKRSIELYHYFMENNYDTLQIIALLANQFRFLFQVKKLSNKGYREDMIAKELGVHPYRVKLAVQTNYNYTEDDYLKYLYKLADIDEKVKMGISDKNLSLELFLLKKDMDI